MKNKKITEREYGKNYPYTIDNVTIRVAEDYPNAVYVEDESGNKYAVNGNAHVYLTKIKKDAQYKGYSSLIFKENIADDFAVLMCGMQMYSAAQSLKAAKHKKMMLKIKHIVSTILLIFFASSLLLFTLTKGIFWGIMSVVFLIQLYQVLNNVGADL